MTVMNVEKDPDNLTMTITAEFEAPIDRVWQLYADPRELEQWWGPPTYPATFVDHDLASGGAMSYYMTGPEGDQHHGWWRVLEVDAPRSFEIEDGFGDETGAPDPNMPVTNMRVDLTEEGGGTKVTIVSTFSSREAMQQVIDMGVEEGLRQAMGQMDDVLAA